MARKKKKTTHKKWQVYLTRMPLFVFVVLLLIFLSVKSFGQINKPHVPEPIVSQVQGATDEAPLPAPSPPVHPIPVQKPQAPLLQLSAKGVLAIDSDSGVVLYEKNPDLKLPPASTTKIMTALVALDMYDLNEEITVGDIVSVSPVMGLFTGEKISVENVLRGALIASANDAAYALAEHDEQGVAHFVQKMNDKAQNLGLTNTHFTNPIGFDDEAHFTSARDLVRLSRIAMDHEELTKIVSLPQVTVADASYSNFHPLKNVNELLGKIPGVSGFKTGLTEAAGECLVTTVERDGHRILTVLLGSEDRFGETEALIDWVFTNFSWAEVTVPIE
ncbi:D-alanyl-D-alanine carboxypeptidase [Candidatus Microgenomates bacterium]|nr:MAG: D-alanyl-D-alanine carboxypeptidase [Candidatus Microgenomates bacterium]